MTDIKKIVAELYPFLDEDVMTGTLRMHIEAKREAFEKGQSFQLEKSKKLVEALKETNTKLAYLKATSLEDVDKAMFQEMINNNLKAIADFEGETNT